MAERKSRGGDSKRPARPEAPRPGGPSETDYDPRVAGPSAPGERRRGARPAPASAEERARLRELAERTVGRRRKA